MDQALSQLFQVLGIAGILAVTAYVVAKGLSPLIAALVESNKRLADAQEKLTAVHTRAMDRWEKSEDRWVKSDEVIALSAKRDTEQAAAFDGMTRVLHTLQEAQVELISHVRPVTQSVPQILEAAKLMQEMGAGMIEVGNALRDRATSIVGMETRLLGAINAIPKVESAPAMERPGDPIAVQKATGEHGAIKLPDGTVVPKIDTSDATKSDPPPEMKESA